MFEHDLKLFYYLCSSSISKNLTGYNHLVFLQCFYSLTAQADWTLTLIVSMGCFICPEIQPLGHYTFQVNGA